MGPRCVSPGPVCDPPCEEGQTCEEVPDVGPTCVPPAPETCTPVEPCDHGACDGECVYSLTNDMMVCVTDSTLTECEGWACDAQPGGDPECVWGCPGYDDPHGDLVEEPALCLSGQVCMDGAFCA